MTATCTVGPNAVDGTRCGEPAVASFVASTGETLYECARHHVPIVPRPAPGTKRLAQCTRVLPRRGANPTIWAVLNADGTRHGSGFWTARSTAVTALRGDGWTVRADGTLTRRT